MTLTVEAVVRKELGNIDDNLYRAKLQQRRDSDWTTGNGKSIDSLIAGYQRERDDLVRDAERHGIRVA